MAESTLVDLLSLGQCNSVALELLRQISKRPDLVHSRQGRGRVHLLEALRDLSRHPRPVQFYGVALDTIPQ